MGMYPPPATLLGLVAVPVSVLAITLGTDSVDDGDTVRRLPSPLTAGTVSTDGSKLNRATGTCLPASVGSYVQQGIASIHVRPSTSSASATPRPLMTYVLDRRPEHQQPEPRLAGASSSSSVRGTAGRLPMARDPTPASSASERGTAPARTVSLHARWPTRPTGGATGRDIVQGPSTGRPPHAEHHHRLDDESLNTAPTCRRVVDASAHAAPWLPRSSFRSAFLYADAAYPVPRESSQRLYAAPLLPTCFTHPVSMCNVIQPPLVRDKRSAPGLVRPGPRAHRQLDQVASWR
ncbi:hypothetical protein CDD83_10388 [Cordyceps sp. RAO-2017]|nr:hypothetical protein CDD83_10388 [Cordyceps sp. RAO-2017]